jgi:hypothetical protein
MDKGEAGRAAALGATLLKAGVAWFFLGVAMHAWYTDQLAPRSTGWEPYFIGVWTGETAFPAQGRSLPGNLSLAIEIKPDHTYAITQKSSIPLLGIGGINYREAGFWKLERDLFRTTPKVCRKILDVEWPGLERVPCRGGAAWGIGLTDDRTWKVEESFGDTRHTVPLRKIN